MKSEFVLRKLSLSEKNREMILKKIKRLERFFEDEDKIVITLYQEGKDQAAELTVFAKGTFYRAEEKSTDVLSAVDSAVDVIEGQIRKYKTKLEKRLRRNAFETEPQPETEEEDSLKITNTKQFVFQSMSAEEAVLQMNLLGHQFYVFKNEDTDSVCVVYKRNNGTYGMIEPVE